MGAEAPRDDGDVTQLQWIRPRGKFRALPLHPGFTVSLARCGKQFDAHQTTQSPQEASGGLQLRGIVVLRKLRVICWRASLCRGDHQRRSVDEAAVALGQPADFCQSERRATRCFVNIWLIPAVKVARE